MIYTKYFVVDFLIKDPESLIGEKNLKEKQNSLNELNEL